MILSSPVGYVRKADLRDVVELAANLRPEDIREIRSTSDADTTLEMVLAFNVAASTDAYTIIDRETGGIIAMLGVAPAGDGTGSVWMHGSPLMQKNPVSIARNTPEIVDRLHARYPILHNWADCRNKVHLRWLSWSGFRFLNVTTTFSNDGSPFVEFFRKGT